MLVQALAAYADTYLSDQLTEEAFEEKPVPFALEIFEDGAFAGIRTRMDDTRKRPLQLSVFKSPVGRMGGIHPILGCDAIQYVLGPAPGAWTKDDQVQNHRERHEAFVSFLLEAAREIRDPALEACAAFYGNPVEVEKARNSLVQHKTAGGPLVTLSVVPRNPESEDPGGPVILRPNVRAYWRQHYQVRFIHRTEKGGEGMCLVSGRLGPIAPTHDKIKGLASLGGQPSGVSLMSFDKPSFRSYGWEQNANSPVSPDRAAAYVLALNDLLRRGKHRRGASQGTVVSTRFDAADEVAFLYWTRTPSDDDIQSLFTEAQPEQIHGLLSAPYTGRETRADPNDFYLMGVSGNGGRLLVRTWFWDTLSNVHTNLRRWFESLRISDVFKQGALSEPPPLWKLLAALAPRRGSGSDGGYKVPPHRLVHLIRKALNGLPLSRSILAAALGRMRAESGDARLSPARAGLIRMCINDIQVQEQRGEPMMTEILNPNESHPAYVSGRLLAVYDRLQYLAQGDVNVTVGDRYYAMASTYPRIAFPRLESLSKAHLKKLRRDRPGAAVNIEKQIREFMGRLTEGVFPAPLSLENQGRFAIGFHHQKAEDARKSAEAKVQREELSEAELIQQPVE